MLREHHENLYNKNHLAKNNKEIFRKYLRKKKKNIFHTRKGKIFLSNDDRSPKPNTGISESESNFSKVRPTIVITLKNYYLM